MTPRFRVLQFYRRGEAASRIWQPRGQTTLEAMGCQSPLVLRTATEVLLTRTDNDKIVILHWGNKRREIMKNLLLYRKGKAQRLEK